ncbi:hypothetical protein [Paracoccus sp. NSM]|uniref:hypothetical protein n=1 Tax=Paracoccus sp. NSM TaxID=3457784 RepID=UPI004035BD01
MAKTPLNTTAEDDLKAMGLPPAFTIDDMRELLDPAEIAAMAEGDDPLIDKLPDDLKAATVKSKSAFEELNPGMEDDDADADADDDADGDDEDADEDQDGDAQDDEEGAADDGDEDEADDAAGDPQDDQQADQTPDPSLTIKDTGDLQAKVEAFDTSLDELQAQYDDGELTTSEFREKLKALTTDQAKAQAELDRATEANQRAQEEYAQTWFQKVERFTEARPELMDTKPIPGLPENASAYTVFDLSLKHVNADPAFAALSMQERIDAAAQIANTYIEKQTGKPLTGPAPGKKGDGKKPGPRTDKRPDPVKTLGGITAASDNDVQDSRFAALDRMDPMDAEAALDRMSPREREKYLAG